jgi:hypothetical protein
MTLDDTGQYFNLRFQKRSTHLFCGPSASGKSKRCFDIIRAKNELIEEGWTISNVVLAYQVWQPHYQELYDEGIVTTLKEGFPSSEEFHELVEPHRENGSIFILDDFECELYQVERAKTLEEIIKVQSRHLNVITFLLFQSLFPPHKAARQISLNVKYIHLLKNPRDNCQFQYLARQLCGSGNYKFLVQAYQDTTQAPYSCFLIDLTQQCHPLLRFRSHYLPRELPMRVYFRKNARL